MPAPESAECFARVVLQHDERLPAEIVIETLRLIFGRSEYEAREIALACSREKVAVCGIFPVAVAEAMVRATVRHITAAGHTAKLHIESVLPTGEGETCSFCNCQPGEGHVLTMGPRASICSKCLIERARQLHQGAARQRITYIHELLEWHFPECSVDRLVIARREFPDRMRADVQAVAESLFADAVRVCGVHGGYSSDEMSVSALMQKGGRWARTIGPVEYDEIDIGESVPVRCVRSALWLLEVDGVRVVALLAFVEGHYGVQNKLLVEICCAGGEASNELASRWFSAIEHAVAASASYRGKVLSLSSEGRYSGAMGSIVVHRLPAVPRNDIILPDRTLALIEHSVVDFARQRGALRSLGQSMKKGLLFHGAPGTGKTHTIRYLAACLAGHTTLLVTAQQIQNLAEYFTLARLLQPSMLVIEDADLIARSRDSSSSHGELILNELLNEMDGLRADAEVFFVLTTNRPETLEEALAARPGRIDQAIEFPIPNDIGRAKLVALYGTSLELPADIVRRLVDRTKGVSAAFIKELMRRLAQLRLERGEGPVTVEDCQSAIAEMLFSGGKLSRALLGATSMGFGHGGAHVGS